MKKKSGKRRRAGRNRMGGQRYKNGELKRLPERNDSNTSTVFETRCRHDGINPRKADRKEILDPLNGYILGKLYIAKAVSEAQRSAGYKYEVTYRDWARTAEMSRMTPPAGSYGQSVPGRDEVSDDEAKAAQRCYFEAADALSLAHRDARSDVIRVCLMGAAPQNIAMLNSGLDVLVSHFG